MSLRVLVVDDEPVARRRICRLLRQVTDVEIVGQCGDGASAVDAIRLLTPDVVFLDVQMPELDGFEVLQALGSDLPFVVFVTAFDQYALRAFDVHALDYLMKPVVGERLLKALERARARQGAHARAGESSLQGLLDQLSQDRKFLTRLPVRLQNRLLIVDLADVDWIAAADNYVTMQAGGRELMLRATLASLERQIDPQAFVRIHRSTIVRVDRIRELVPESHGDFTVVLKDGRHLTLTRGYRANLEKALGRRF